MAEICTRPSMGISFSCTNRPNSSALVIVASKVSPTRGCRYRHLRYPITSRDASSARRSRCELSAPRVCNSALAERCLRGGDGGGGRGGGGGGGEVGGCVCAGGGGGRGVLLFC